MYNMVLFEVSYLSMNNGVECFSFNTKDQIRRDYKIPIWFVAFIQERPNRLNGNIMAVQLED